MKLYYSPTNCSAACFIAAHYSGLPIDCEQVDLREHKTLSGTNFFSVNPKGSVPCLILDDGTVLNEGPAILQYIADKSWRKMAPENKTNDRYMVQMFLNFASGELLPLIREMVNPATDEQFRVHCRELFNVKLSYLDNATFNKDYLVANFYTIADIYVYYLLAWAANNGVDLTAYPQVQAYYDKMNSKNCVKDAMLRMGKNPDKVSDLPEQECVECGCV